MHWNTVIWNLATAAVALAKTGSRRGSGRNLLQSILLPLSSVLMPFLSSFLRQALTALRLERRAAAQNTQVRLSLPPTHFDLLLSLHLILCLRIILCIFILNLKFLLQVKN